MPRKSSQPPPVEPREFRSVEEIDIGIAKLRRRITELDQLDIRASESGDTGAVDVARSNVREVIREVFGTNSPESSEHEYIDIWGGPMFVNMSRAQIIEARERGRQKVIGILNGLVNRLQEKRGDLTTGVVSPPSTYIDRLNLHPRVLDVTRDLFLDGYPWEAVFAGAKALVNYIKERSGQHDLDGAPLVRTVFSSKNRILAFNELATQTDFDEQQGMMHLFEGAVIGIRNPGGHSFPEGTEQRAIEYISLLSLLAYRVQEANRRTSP
jgi:uncharacterized protein (TIGR02391 family)